MARDPRPPMDRREIAALCGCYLIVGLWAVLAIRPDVPLLILRALTQ